MKMSLVLLVLVLVIAACGVVACRLLANRPPEATIPLTARPKGKVAIIYFSQSKVGNTATVACWIQKHAGGDLSPCAIRRTTWSGGSTASSLNRRRPSWAKARVLRPENSACRLRQVRHRAVASTDNSSF